MTAKAALRCFAKRLLLGVMWFSLCAASQPASAQGIPLDMGTPTVGIGTTPTTNVQETVNQNLADDISKAAANLANGTSQPSTLDERNNASLNAAADEALVNITGKNSLCNQPFDEAFRKAREKATTVELTRDNAFFKYQISAAFAANCVGRLIGYAQKLGEGVDAIVTMATATNGDPIVAAITLAASQILNIIFRQIVANLENQICSLTTQVTNSLDSAFQNAICIKGSLNLGIPNPFSFNIDLKLPEKQCDGIAINPLKYAQLDPSTGQPSTSGESVVTSDAFAVTGMGNYSSGVGGSAGFEDMLDPRGGGSFGASAEISGEPDVIDEGDTGEVIQPSTNPPVAGNYCFDLNKAIADRRAKAPQWYSGGKFGHCGVGVRNGLCAGGLTYWCGPHGDAFQMGAGLIASGAYYKLGDNLPQNYGAQPGDIIVIQPYGKHRYGHIQMSLGGGDWASDFKTQNMFGVIPRPPPLYTIYRLKPNTKANGNGTCK